MKLNEAVLGVCVLGLIASAGPAQAGGRFVPVPANEPEVQGDQVIAYYDARPGFTTFVAVRNADFSSPERAIRLTFLSGGFSVPFTRSFALSARQLRVIDVGALREEGLPAQAGVVIVNAVNGADEMIATRALTGSFTVANLLTGSGWGGPSAARIAYMPPPPDSLGTSVQPSGRIPAVQPPIGTVIDGLTVSLQPIQPRAVELAAYYDPEDLAPVEDGGNQLIFVSYVDDIGAVYDATPQTTTFGVQASRSDATPIIESTFGASGVVVTDLASVAGPGVNGSAGWVRFFADPEVGTPLNRMVFFVEALGTFGTGYRLPALPSPSL